MSQPNPEQVLQLLQTINYSGLETFKNFPDVVMAGKQRVNKEDVDYLFDQGYLEEQKTDSFGKFLKLTKTARDLITRND
jgi:hypothetical protein